MSVPYRSSPVFDENTLPAALQNEHNTKAGVWGVIRVLEGQLHYTIIDPKVEQLLTPDNPGLILPEQKHFVTALWPVRVRVDFYDAPPDWLLPPKEEATNDARPQPGTKANA
ncbi:MAG: DUF1971 domain-containing protein [Alphaproteobacteria bacterium]|nr:DUF1971 domain-containing protein [Alphaproteobacteria bacterium]